MLTLSSFETNNRNLLGEAVKVDDPIFDAEMSSQK
jgi:hypothetical protein